MKGPKRRAKLTSKAMDEVIDRVSKALETDPSDFLFAAVRKNFQLSLEERRTLQSIKESKRRIANDEEVLALIQEQVIGRHFVLRDEERTRVMDVLVAWGFPFAKQFVDLIYPSDAGQVTRLSKDLLAAWKEKYQK